MMKKCTKILITGGAGFIGSHLCDYFVNKGYHVVCLDNLSTGYLENISHLLDNPLFEFHQGDIRNYDTCLEVCKNVEYILHQAALGSVPRSVAYPDLVNENNVCGFINILKAATNTQVKRIIFASSSSVYGDSDIIPRVEDKLGNPLSPYAASKIAKELYANVYTKIHGMEIIALRYFNVFGERQAINGEYTAVIPRFIEAMVKQKNPIINGIGLQTRDYTYVQNVVIANDLALNYDLKEKVFEIFNVGCGYATSVIQLYEKVRNIISKYISLPENITPIYGPERKGDVMHTCASLEKISNSLGYKPLYSLDEGLVKTIEWYLKKLKKIEI